jgi:uncharacterized OB-fold protein
LPITERLDAASSVRAWRDKIPLHYEYTAGVAGEKFLRGLKEGRILAGRCGECGVTSLPLRMYCVDCYSEVVKSFRVAPVGVVRAVTRGAKTFAYVEFEGVKGGLVNALIGPARVGSRVAVVFRPKSQRTGAISDVLGFERHS